MDQSDAELLARFRGGDESALDPLFGRYEGPVFRFRLNRTPGTSV